MRVSAAPAFRNRSSNPYNALLSEALLARGVEVSELDSRTVLSAHPDIVHLHWPESALNKPRRAAAAYRSVELLVLLHRLRRRGTRVVWTAHNLRSHFQRYPRAERLWWRVFLRLVDGWTSLSATASEQAVAAHPRLRALPHAVVPHGHFREAYPDTSRDEARSSLGLTAADQLVLFVGRVKPYKGVPELVRAFAQLDRPGARLLVAGRCDEPSLREELQRCRDPRVELRLEAVDEQDMARLLRAADLVVLPFRSVLNSGSLLLALSFDAPVLCREAGAVGDVASALPAWVSTYSGELTAALLSSALDRPRPAGRPDLSAFDWPRVAEGTEELYARVLERHGDVR